MKRYFFNRCIHTFFSYLTAGCVMVTLVPPLIILLLFLPASYREENRLIYGLLDLLYRGLLGALFVPVRLEGGERIPTEPSIIVANHQSSIDIPMIGALMNMRPHVWYALAYYARMPVLGFFVRRIGFPLNRDASETAAHDFLRGLRSMRQGNRHVILFPEGARYADGDVHEFLEGFGLIARHTGRPVIPVYMPDNYLVYPPHSFWVNFNPLKAVVGPVFVREGDESDELFVARVRDWFLQEARAHLHQK